MPEKPLSQLSTLPVSVVASICVMDVLPMMSELIALKVRICRRKQGIKDRLDAFVRSVYCNPLRALRRNGVNIPTSGATGDSKLNDDWAAMAQPKFLPTPLLGSYIRISMRHNAA